MSEDEMIAAISARLVFEAEKSIDRNGKDTDPRVAAIAIGVDRSARHIEEISVGTQTLEVVVAHRSEFYADEHAEFTLLERKLINETVNGDSYRLFVTLEPCSKRGETKRPCAERVIKRGLTKITIGMLDPNPKIFGNGVHRLLKAGVKIDYLPPSARENIRAINEDFIDDQRRTFSFRDFIKELPQAFIYPKEAYLYSVYVLFRHYSPEKIAGIESLLDTEPHDDSQGRQKYSVVIANTALNTFLDPHEFQASLAQGFAENRGLERIYLICTNKDIAKVKRLYDSDSRYREEIDYILESRNSAISVCIVADEPEVLEVSQDQMASRSAEVGEQSAGALENSADDSKGVILFGEDPLESAPDGLPHFAVVRQGVPLHDPEAEEDGVVSHRLFAVVASNNLAYRKKMVQRWKECQGVLQSSARSGELKDLRWWLPKIENS